MILENQSETEKIVINTCRCGCGSEIRITRYPEIESAGYKEYYISYCSSLFDQEQLGVFKLIGRRIKRAFYDLIGKNYLYMDIVMNDQEYNEFIEKLQKLQK